MYPIYICMYILCWKYEHSYLKIETIRIFKSRHISRNWHVYTTSRSILRNMALKGSSSKFTVARWCLSFFSQQTRTGRCQYNQHKRWPGKSFPSQTRARFYVSGFTVPLCAQCIWSFTIPKDLLPVGSLLSLSLCENSNISTVTAVEYS